MRASWLAVFTALVLVFVALTGVLAKDPSILSVWCMYFVSVGFFLAIMFFRVQSLKIIYHALHSLNASVRCSDGPLLELIAGTVKDISSQAVAFFVKSGSISILNKAILYVRQNEDCAHIRIIHIYDDEAQIPRKLLRNVSVLDEAYPKVKVDLILVKGQTSAPLRRFAPPPLSILRTPSLTRAVLCALLSSAAAPHTQPCPELCSTPPTATCPERALIPSPAPLAPPPPHSSAAVCCRACCSPRRASSVQR